MKNKSNYTEIESKALWYLQRYASSSENLRNYLRRKVKDSHLSINSEEIINEQYIRDSVKNIDLIAACRLAKKISIGPYRKNELTEKIKMRELGVLSRAGFSYNIVKKILFEMSKEELEDIYDQR